MRRAARFQEAAHGPEGQPARTLTRSPNVLIGQRGHRGTAATAGPMFHIHLDADRDGLVDDDWRNADRWDWDEDGLGAIVLPYLDTSKPRQPEEIAPLVVRRDPTTAGRSAAGWRGELYCDNAYKLTLLDGTGASARPLTEPPRAMMIDLDLSQDEVEFGMQATQHPGPYLGRGRDPDPRARNVGWVFDGLLRLHLRIFDPSGTMTQSETALVRVAPWVAFSHFDPSKRIFVHDWPLSQDIRDKISMAQQPVPMQLIVNGDQWTQDQGEPGFTSAPAVAPEDESQPVLLALKNAVLENAFRPMDVIVTRHDEAEAIDAADWQGIAPASDSIDYGGNIECIPPFVHSNTGRVYGFGRLYYGMGLDSPRYTSSHRSFYGPLRRFFDAQSVQDPFFIDTGWLLVGHVDEVVSVMPMKDARLGFRIITVSHDLALSLCDPIPDQTPAMGPYASSYTQHFIDTGFLKGNRPGNTGRYDFRGNASFVRTKMASIRQDFMREVGLQPDDFIELPVLFGLTAPSPNTAVSALAFTPGVVNGLVLTHGDPEWAADRSVTFVAPKPYGPALHADGRPPSAGNDCVFEEYIRDALGPTSRTGVQVLFADDFEGYHTLQGEVHCGTNSLRVPPADRRWWGPRQDTRRNLP